MSCQRKGVQVKYGRKRLWNNPTVAVDESLQGFAMVHSGLVLLEGCRAVLRRDYNNIHDKVKLISGGGAGNEPTHIGFVGPGMLTAAITGDIFTAPSPDSILKVIQELATDHSPGVLLIVQNYTGYRLNFGLAKLRAENRGLIVNMITVKDDVSLKSFEKTAGRRGLGGTLFILKVAGAMAEDGKKLNEIHSVCKRLASGENVISIGLGHRVPPSSADCECSQFIECKKMEIGCGLHGEPGVLQVTFANTKDTVSQLIYYMMENGKEFNFYPNDESGNSVAVMINNLGGISQLETYIFAMEAMTQLRDFGFKIERAYMGSLMTSLDANGFQLSIMKLASDSNLIEYLDAETSAPAWPKIFSTKTLGFEWEEEPSLSTPGLHLKSASGMVPETKPLGPSMAERTGQVFLMILTFACEALIACAEQLNIMDEDSGDGDCGTTLRKGADALKSAIKAGEIEATKPFVAFSQISHIAETLMGGLQGGLYSIFFDAGAKVFAGCPEDRTIDASIWLEALTSGNDAISEFGKASRGDRTMLDPLLAAQDKLCDLLSTNCHPIIAFGEAVKAAETQAIKTRRMPATVGRASLVKCKSFEHPDPGAHAVGIWMRAAYEGVKLKFNCECES
ncbi:triokinase/FMN cyclase isoform X2 [Orussus abietinus]|uniref:triokinase/FMN cyclase isoform X2 n=1 Tax=Orussus abietinus TaxID=222816 RepID=UPI0006262EA8|nr:triokinase/FMN cyclase isoform X2 [Orussus abietinus]